MVQVEDERRFLFGLYFGVCYEIDLVLQIHQFLPKIKSCAAYITVIFDFLALLFTILDILHLDLLAAAYLFGSVNIVGIGIHSDGKICEEDRKRTSTTQIAVIAQIAQE